MKFIVSGGGLTHLPTLVRTSYKYVVHAKASTPKCITGRHENGQLCL